MERKWLNATPDEEIFEEDKVEKVLQSLFGDEKTCASRKQRQDMVSRGQAKGRRGSGEQNPFYLFQEQ